MWKNALRIWFSCIGVFLLVSVFHVSSQEIWQQIIFADAIENTQVRELDLGDYQSEMEVGEKQLLDVTVLPAILENRNITYSSSNTSVATVNGMGRITAVSIGKTTISVSYEKVTEKFTLVVKAKEGESTVSVTDLDIGDCPSELEVGSSQLLSVTTIPVDATNQNIKYSSSNPSVATVNAIGRVTGLKTGKTTITVTSGSASKTFILKVIEKKSEEIPAKDIEINDYEKKLEVDKTMTLSATVVPSNATDAVISYKSSDELIATVNSSGEVKGISKGKVTITASVGKIKKKIHLNIVVATSQISMNSTYLVLKPGAGFKLSASVSPGDAPQNVTYKASNQNVISVSKNGMVVAKACGNSSVIVSNGDTSVAVTVIVNKSGKTSSNGNRKEKSDQMKTSYSDEVTVYDCPVISSEMLKYFYENKKMLTIKSDKYTILINGKDIVNYENEFDTGIEFVKNKDGVEFVLNHGNKLCGTVTVIINARDVKGQYIYLYNQSKKKYEKLDVQNIYNVSFDIAGKYLITDKKLQTFKFNKLAVGGSIGIVIILSGVYIIVKKRYWFW